VLNCSDLGRGGNGQGNRGSNRSYLSFIQILLDLAGWKAQCWKMSQRIIGALAFGVCITGLAFALFICLSIIFDDGGAKEWSLPLVEIPLNFICAVILWPVIVGAFLNHGDTTGTALWLLLIGTVLFWGFVSDFLFELRRRKQRVRPNSKV
jgi:hypothetical protein